MLSVRRLTVALNAQWVNSIRWCRVAWLAGATTRLWQLRLPRTLLAVLVGASLALALQAGAKARGWTILLIEPFAPEQVRARIAEWKTRLA